VADLWEKRMARPIGFAMIAWLMCVALTGAGRAADVDITGKWTASFDTQVGRQNYTYEFAVRDKVLSGTIKSDMGQSDVIDGKVEGDKVTFVEKLAFQGNEVRITYTGQIVSSDEIKFTRQVGDFATEQLVAKRSK
jgi:hypothetical protein